ncbi:hypothetical protein ABZ912_20055 [Nonomuraea angiospora]|uniref:hypothetical protein n=1 Tax=Nonomuraea angiospora TaxID=46172 RepID=UPI0033F7E739
MEPAVIVAAIGAVASIAASFLTARATTKANERRSDAEERVTLRQVEADAYKRARETYDGAMERMQAEILRQARQINSLQRQVARLNKQVREAGLVPVTSSEEEEP